MTFEEFIRGLDMGIRAAFPDVAPKELGFSSDESRAAWTLGDRRFTCSLMADERHVALGMERVSLRIFRSPYPVPRDAHGIKVAVYRSSELDPERYRGWRGTPFTYET